MNLLNSDWSLCDISDWSHVGKFDWSSCAGSEWQACENSDVMQPFDRRGLVQYPSPLSQIRDVSNCCLIRPVNPYHLETRKIKLAICFENKSDGDFERLFCNNLDASSRIHDMKQ